MLQEALSVASSQLPPRLIGNHKHPWQQHGVLLVLVLLLLLLLQQQVAFSLLLRPFYFAFHFITNFNHFIFLFGFFFCTELCKL